MVWKNLLMFLSFNILLPKRKELLYNGLIFGLSGVAKGGNVPPLRFRTIFRNHLNPKRFSGGVGGDVIPKQVFSYLHISL